MGKLSKGPLLSLCKGAGGRLLLVPHGLGPFARSPVRGLRWNLVLLSCWEYQIWKAFPGRLHLWASFQTELSLTPSTVLTAFTFSTVPVSCLPS